MSGALRMYQDWMDDPINKRLVGRIGGGGCLNVSELDRRPKQKEVEREEWGGGSVLMSRDQNVPGLVNDPINKM